MKFNYTMYEISYYFHANVIYNGNSNNNYYMQILNIYNTNDFMHIS